MHPQEYDQFSESLQARLATNPHVLGLVALGSYAQADLRDQWSDHDFWVITTPEAQESLLTDLSWLPNAHEIVITIRAAPQYYTLLYRNGHQVEFGVFDLDHLQQAKTNRYRIVFDNGQISAHVAAIYQATWAAQQVEPDLRKILSSLLVTLCVGVARYRRGEQLSAHQLIFGYALTDLLMLVTAILPAEQRPYALDRFDARRRFEQAYPTLSRSIVPLLRQDIPQAAQAMLTLTEQLFGETLPEDIAQATLDVREYLLNK